MKIYRLTTTAERHELQTFLDAHFSSTAPNQVPAAQHDYLFDPRMYAIRSEGRIVAALFSHQAAPITYNFVRDEARAATLAAGHSWFDQIATDPEFRGRGYASALMNRAEHELLADGVQYWMGCVTRDGNEQYLRKFYTAHGFTTMADGQPLPSLLGFNGWSSGEDGATGRRYRFNNAAFFAYKRIEA